MIESEVVKYILISIGYAVVFFSIIPLIRSDFWFIRVFDYPRFQKFWINGVILAAFFFIADFKEVSDLIFLGVVVINQGYLLSLIWHYTPLAPVQMKRNPGKYENRIKVLIANVFQENRSVDLCRHAIEQHKPSIVLLVETDERWCNEITTNLKDYPYRILQPQNNTYGMLLLSQLEIIHHTVRFLVESDIPSITADVKTSDGLVFRLYCLHPKPPIPSESSNSTERDAEILLIGKEAKKLNKPVIVAGDLNDVAWSYTTNLFLKVSSLLDPRIGRGFYSTFHANHRLFRWPLDHVFCSSHFYLNSLRRLPTIGSDHFPILLEVSLMPNEITANQENEKDADAKDQALSDEKITAAK